MHIYLYFGIVLKIFSRCLHHSACILVSDDDVFSRGKKEKNVLPGAAPALRESGLERPARRYVTTNQSALHQWYVEK